MKNKNALPAPNPKPRVLLLLDGLIIGHFDEKNSTYQAGVLAAADHQFLIRVNEFQDEVIPGQNIRCPISSRAISVMDLAQTNRKWTFEIQQSPKPNPAEAFDSGKEPDRINPPDQGTPEAMDHRWPPRLDDKKDFPDHDGLTKEAGVMSPVIFFKNGRFHTRNLSGDMAVFRKKPGEPREPFGAMSTEFGASIEDIKDGAKILLRTESGDEIFNLELKPNRSFAIVFQNIPPSEQAQGMTPNASTGGMAMAIPGVPSHFQLYYSAFTPRKKRYDLTTLSEGFPTPGSLSVDPTATRGAPAPFRCGPSLVSDDLG